MLVISIIAVVFLLVCSAFFSASETALMAVNRYKLQYQAEKGERAAQWILDLVNTPQKILSTILLGNNFVNIAATSIGTSICIVLFGESQGVLIATVLMTFVVLVFSEITPKTYAAIHAEKVALKIIHPILLTIKALAPLVKVIDWFTHHLMRLLKVDETATGASALSAEELKTVVNSAADSMPREGQRMLIGVLDLDEVMVGEAMVPRNEIHGIDLADPWEKNVTTILQSHYNRLVVYRERIDQVLGILHLGDVLNLMHENRFSEEEVIKALKPSYFVPENTPLRVQLLQFQKTKERSALVVDEYGDIQGLVTLEDILAHIVGDIDPHHENMNEIEPQEDGSYVIQGSILVRQLNRDLKLKLPTGNSRTLSGLIIETLGSFPEGDTCLELGGCRMEVIDYSDGVIHRVRLRIPEARS